MGDGARLQNAALPQRTEKRWAAGDILQAIQAEEKTVTAPVLSMKQITLDDVRQPIGKMPLLPKGCDEWKEEHGYQILKIHYSADPSKTQTWADAQKKKSPSENTFRREFEIDHYAGSGSVMYPEFVKAIHVCSPFPVPHEWTRYQGIDPHKRRPHAFLWMAVDPQGDHWYYREYWPSRIYGKKGDTPEDDKLYTVDEYAKAVLWMEGPEVKYFAPGGFADNQFKAEKIRQRIMDTHGKAIFTTTVAGKDEPETFWERYQKNKIRCKEAVKDIGSGRDKVGERLHPRETMHADGPKQEAIIHIFDTLPELIHELRTGRFPSLTPSQAERQDPTEKELQKRKHMLDLIRYIEMEDPTYVEPRRNYSVQPLEEGISY